MCQKRNSVRLKLRGKILRLDPCLRETIKSLNDDYGILTLASCCGHGHYPQTIVAKTSYGKIYELRTGVEIPRTRNFYRKDAQGFYFIPEVPVP